MKSRKSISFLFALAVLLLISSCSHAATPQPLPARRPPPLQPATPTKLSLATIPGLAPADVKAYINAQYNLECAPVAGGVFCSNNSDGANLAVGIYSDKPDSVRYIEVVIIQADPNQNTALQFLGYLAAISYTQAQPNDARNWVEKSLPELPSHDNMQSTSFGGVKFEILGIPTGYSLRIGEMK